MFLRLLICNSQSYHSTCPQSISECTPINECTECDETCQYCQNLDDSICGQSDCMSCVDETLYTLIPIWGDGTGYCKYIGDDTQTTFFEFQHTNHELTWFESNDEQLPITPLFSATFTYNNHIFIIGGILFNSKTSPDIPIFYQNPQYNQIYISYNQETERPTQAPGNIATPNTSNAIDIPPGTCCGCAFYINGTECPGDIICTDAVCGQDVYCCSTEWDDYCGDFASDICEYSNGYQTLQPSPAPTTFDNNYKETCPAWIQGCSIDNLCNDCYYLCEYCQNTDSSDMIGNTCTEFDCMTCIADSGYVLVPIWGDGTGYCKYIGETPSPTTDYLLPEIKHWYNFSMDDLYIYNPFCESQCYTTPEYDFNAIIVDQANAVFILYPFECGYNPAILYEIYPNDLLEGKLFNNHKQHNLTAYLCDQSKFDQTQNIMFADACLSLHPLFYTLYIVYRDRIVLFNTETTEIVWSNAKLPNNVKYNASRGCIIDQYLKYLWITDADAQLFAYDIVQDFIIDVGMYNLKHYSIEYYTDSNGFNRINRTKYFYSYYDIEFPRMIPLSGDFILISSWKSYHILKSNTTFHISNASSHKSSTQTQYGDIVCHNSYLPNNLHSGSAPIYSNYRLLNFGSFAFLDPDCDITFNNISENPNCAEAVFPTNIISYFQWQKDWKLILSPTTSSVLFGDKFMIDNQFIGGCDLSYYYPDYLYAIPLSSLNPFSIEVLIKSDIIRQTYMYLINGTLWKFDEDTTYFGASNCYLCPNKLNDFINQNWNVEAQIISDGCSICSEGLRLDVTDKSAAGTVYDIEMEIIEYIGNFMLTLQSEKTQIELKNCDPGFGIASGSSIFDCNECPFNQFSLKDQLKPCIACSGVNEGLDCEGGNKTILSYNWWVASYDVNTKLLKTFYNVEWYDELDYASPAETPLNDKIITALCPPNYCCQSIFGCDYLSQYLANTIGNKHSLLCAQGRDFTVPLCGKCLPNFSEMLGSTKCSDKCSNEWTALLPITFTLTFILALYVLFIDSKPRKYSPQQINLVQILKKDDIDGFQTIIFKPILYYFQSLSPILNTRGITLWLSPILAVFNFNLDAAGSDDSALCWSAGLNANIEILLNLMFPSLLLINILSPIICINHKGFVHCSNKKMVKCFAIVWIPYYAASLFRVLLITIGVVLTVCFKYLTYIKIGDEYLMFYSADQKAFGAWWISGLLGVIFIIFVFIVLFWRIKKQEMESRFASKNKYRKFVKSFKRKYWYWEFVLFSRRFFIAFFSAIQFVGADYTNFIFVMILMIYFGLQIQFKPFAFLRVNRIETLCLVLLLGAFISANFIRLNDDDSFIAAVLSLCILIPLILVFYYGILLLIHRYKLYNANNINKLDKQSAERINHDVNRMLSRTPKSFKDLVTKNTKGSTYGNYIIQTNVDTREDNYNLPDIDDGIAIAISNSPKKYVEMQPIQPVTEFEGLNTTVTTLKPAANTIDISNENIDDKNGEEEKDLESMRVNQIELNEHEIKQKNDDENINESTPMGNTNEQIETSQSEKSKSVLAENEDGDNDI